MRCRNRLNGLSSLAKITARGRESRLPRTTTFNQYLSHIDSHPHEPPFHPWLLSRPPLKYTTAYGPGSIFANQWICGNPIPWANGSIFKSCSIGSFLCLPDGQTQQPRNRNTCLNSSRRKSMWIWPYISVVIFHLHFNK